MKLVKPILAALGCLLLPGLVGAQNLSLTPRAGFPVATDSYQLSAGADLGLRFDAGPLQWGPQGGWSGLFLKADAGRVDVVTLGASASWTLLSAGGVSLGPTAGAGGYGAFLTGAPALYNPYLSAGARLGLNLGALTLGIEPQVTSLLARRDGQVRPFWTEVGLGFRLGWSGAGGAAAPVPARLRLFEPRLEPYLPSFYKFYASEGMGSVVLENGESSPLSRLQVRVYVPRYMDGPQTLTSVAELAPGGRLTVPLAALFRNEVLGVTETDAAQLQITADYEVEGSPRQASRQATLRILGRNSIQWNDDRRAAAFITGRDPTVLKFARNVVASVPVDKPGAGNEAFRKASAVFSALGEFGLRYVVDPNSSYQDLSAKASVDYVQFPVQTLDYRSGDCDDLTVLACALWEAVGLETAFITVPGHILPAFSPGMSEAEYRAAFPSQTDYIVVEGKVWLPVEGTTVNRGFLSSWSEGARQWRQGEARGEARLYPVRAAWAVYGPSYLDSVERTDVVGRFPAATAVNVRYGKELKSLADRELTPLVATLTQQLKAKPSAALQNKLGTAYARFGQFDKAEAPFQEAAKANFAPAVFNLGNLKYLAGDLAGAQTLYEKALKLNPASAAAAAAVVRVALDQGNVKKAEAALPALARLDPPRAADLGEALKAGAGTETGRAGNAAGTVGEWIE